MTITFNQLNSLTDILPNNRHILYFPSVLGLQGRDLTLNNTQVTIPTYGTAHIRVKLLGHSIGFSGGIDFDNSLICSFYERSKGEVLRNLTTWLNASRNMETGARLPKSQMAANGTLDVINTIGEAAFSVELINVFPIQITWPELAHSSNGPTEFQTTFNVDGVKYTDGVVSNVKDFLNSNANYF